MAGDRARESRQAPERETRTGVRRWTRSNHSAKAERAQRKRSRVRATRRETPTRIGTLARPSEAGLAARTRVCVHDRNCDDIFLPLSSPPFFL